jgi:hypothetical protein
MGDQRWAPRPPASRAHLLGDWVDPAADLEAVKRKPYYKY